MNPVNQSFFSYSMYSRDSMYSIYRALEKLHQTCSALCIYQTILELSEYSGIYNPDFQLS